MKLSHKFDSSILRAYDIRGIVDKTIFLEDAYFIGRSIARVLFNHKLELKVCVGFDGRLTSPSLNEMLVKGFLDSGVDVINLGLVPTPLLYYSTIKLSVSAGIIITGSHNPPDYNGFKIMINGCSFFGEQIKELARIALNGDFPIGEGEMINLDKKQEYVEFLANNILGKIDDDIKIAWDPGNGATGEVVEMLTSIIPGTHIVINETIDGNFPSHHPDPTIKENLLQLVDIVKNEKCNLGIAFDGDGDRIGIIDDKGEIINGEQILYLLSRDLLSRKPGASVIGDVKTSDIIFEAISKLGGNPIMWRTGHSYIKSLMKEKKAMLAGEMSGHVFFAEDYFGFDDALFGACKLIKFISHSSESINDMLKSLPVAYSTPELKIEVNEEDKFILINKVQTLLKNKEIPFNNLDGVRVKGEGGWWLLRASNTQNILIVRIEAISVYDRDVIFAQIIDLCQKVGVPTVNIIEDYQAFSKLSK